MTRATSRLGLYVHIPFCAARCPYCDFATAPATSALRARYLDALAREIAREGAALGRTGVRTLYVGGGTPSLLEPDEIGALAAAIASAFSFAPREATVEANPATARACWPGASSGSRASRSARSRSIRPGCGRSAGRISRRTSLPPSPRRARPAWTSAST